jgi:hypothetical protein
MSKVLRVVDGNYSIVVENPSDQFGGQITLDTGNNIGRVRVTGDLIVEGNTTTVNTANLNIEDNIIVINSGEFDNPGITEITAGIQIDRGSLDDALLLFDESIQYDMPPDTTNLNQGIFVFKDAGGDIKPIQTNFINTGGAKLYLVGSGNGVISVAGTNNYESNVVADDDVPNKKYVDDFVETFFTTNFQNRIDDGVTTTSYVQVDDRENTGFPSIVTVAIDNDPVATFESTSIQLNSIRITDTHIESFNTGEDLTLGSPGTGSVKIEDSLIITPTPGVDDSDIDPSDSAEGLKLYVKERAEGGTGLYFVNTDTTRDEIISRNRSLVFSMLF